MQTLNFMLILIILANCETRAEIPKEQCKKTLMDIQSMLCSNMKDTGKSSEEAPLIQTLDGDELWPWMAKRFSYTLAESVRAKQIANLVEECCSTPCHLSQLLSLC